MRKTVWNRPPSNDTCLQCGTPFDQARELASPVPGRSFVADMERGRVWRVCAKCSTPEFLGKSTSLAVLSELKARSTLDGLGHGRTVRIGEIQFELVDCAANAPPMGKWDAATIATLARRRVRAFKALDAAMVLALVGWGLWHNGLRGAFGTLELLAIISLTLQLQQAIKIARRHTAQAAVRIGLIAVGVAAVMVLGPRVGDEAWLTPWAIVLLIVSVAVLRRLIPPFPSKLFRRVAQTEQLTTLLNDGILSFADGTGAPSIGGVDGALLSGQQATDALLRGAAADVARLSASQSAAAVQLSRRHPSFASLGAVLRTIRPDDAGRYSWSELPLVWRAAIAFSALNEQPGPMDLVELNRIADIADMLGADGGSTVEE